MSLSLNKILLLAALLQTGLVGCRTTPKPVFAEPTENAPPAPGKIIEVKEGDTLFKIAQANDMAVEELAEVNGILNPDELSVGQILFLPDDDPLDIAKPKVAESPPELPPLKLKAVPKGVKWFWPIDAGVLLREYSRSKKRPFDGLLVAAPQGTPVRAVNGGKVAYTGDPGTQYGTMIIVKHSDGYTSIYSHLDAVNVKAGDAIERGTPIGKVGSSGRAESPRLHFEIREGRKPIDPLLLLEPKDEETKNPS